jgi:paraquat-inducible protein B
MHIVENNMKHLDKDPTDKYQRQIQQTLKKCNVIISKQEQKYVNNMKPMAAQLNIFIKTHKENISIRPVITTNMHQHTDSQTLQQNAKSSNKSSIYLYNKKHIGIN